MNNVKPLVLAEIAKVLNAVMQIDDWNAYLEKDDGGGGGKAGRRNGGKDDDEDDAPRQNNGEDGVSVVFEEDDDDEDEGGDGARRVGLAATGDDNVDFGYSGGEYATVVKEDEDKSDSDDDDDDDEDDNKNKVSSGLLQPNGAGGLSDSSSSSQLKASSIDDFYVQRFVSKFKPDPLQAQALAEQVLQALAPSSTSANGANANAHVNDDRAAENKLLLLLGFDNFDAVKFLVGNRLFIHWCIALRRAGGHDGVGVGVGSAAGGGVASVVAEMEADPSGVGAKVLAELGRHTSVDEWADERMKQAVGDAKTGGGTTNGSRANANANNANANNANANGGVRDEDMEVDDLAAAANNSSNNSHKNNSKTGAQMLDLEQLAFKDGARLMSNTRCELPDKSWRATKPGYEEIHVPAVRSVVPEGEIVVKIADLPEWTQSAFQGMERLTRLQSKMCDAALRNSDNLLLCAPTGAGKTNVAMLSMLNVLAQHRLPDGSLDLKAFKIVYVAPMKALVQEVVKNFGKRLAALGLTVRELSGDSTLTRAEIEDTQVIVTTPEKWDIITRKSDDRTYTQLVRLMIIDEIHLLHDDRGPVLESLVSRTIRQVELTQEPVRIVGLSATLPNYVDVAAFLRVKLETGLYFFDSSFRPVPLQMQYIGITEKKALKRINLMNEICYEKVMLQVETNNQVLIFVHSRADCAKTAKALRDLAVQRDEGEKFVRPDSASRGVLDEEVGTVKNADLKDVLQYGFGIHHAGMQRSDRELVEDLFADNHIKVLISTATLAWGVNLPAHSVIIKGTQVYSPDKGGWVELSPLDVQQMLGRAGRPQFDSEGEGIILTQHSELQYYLSLTNLQLPVESQLIKVLPNHLNAEIVAGSITSIEEAVDWLGYSYLFVRMMKNPTLYGIDPAVSDPLLKQRRLDLVHSAACLIEKAQLCRYDRRSGALQPTALGKVASHYYISHESMAVYNTHLKPTMSDIELLRLFAMSGEFKQIHVRPDEKLELQKLALRVPIPVKESMEDPSAKINVLLQAYISKLSLEGFALLADMAHVQQSAGRIMRCLFEISMKRGWAELARLALDFSKMVSMRMWRSQSPLRQFKGVPDIVARKLERKDIPFERYGDLEAADLGELVGAPKMGKTLFTLVQQFPKLELSATVQPITRSLLKVELTITPAFDYDVTKHDYAQLFWIIVEDANSENILHNETFMLKAQDAGNQHYVSFSVPVLDPLPPQYFVKVISDRWLHSEAVVPISFRHLILPQKFPPPTQLLDLQPLPVSSLNSKALQSLYKHIPHFNPIQTQTFQELYHGDGNVLVCAPTGSGKTVCAEFAILRMFSADAKGKCVYVVSKPIVVKQKTKEWTKRFGALGISVAALTGDSTEDLKIMSKTQIVLSSAENWDAMSRRWRQRKTVQNIDLVVFDELHLLGGADGPTLEVVISRMRYIATEVAAGPAAKKMRIVGLGASIANAKDVGEWMGVKSSALFNFSAKVRPVPLEIYLQSFDVQNFSSRLLAMAKPCFNAIRRYGESKPVIVYVPSRRQAQLTAIDLMTFSASATVDVMDGGSSVFTFLKNGVSDSELEPVLSTVREPALAQTLAAGIGFIHQGIAASDRDRVEALFNDGIVSVLVVPFDMCWEVEQSAHFTVIMGTESYDGKEQRYVDHSISDVLQMMGKAGRPLLDANAKCLLLCHTPKKEHLKKLIYDPLPIESHLDSYLHDHFCSEIATKTITSQEDAVDYLTWSFLYRRLTKNPNYYNLTGSTPTHLSEHLSEMAETVLDDLAESKCISVNADEGTVAPLNLGMVASYYYINYTTIELIASSVTAKTKTRGIIEILSASNEFTTLPLRQNEEKTLSYLARTLTNPLPETASFNDPSTKALVLLQSHFSRTALSTDLKGDQVVVVGESIRILQAVVDVISSQGFLKPALAAMEVSQMVTQALWGTDNNLMQIPHFKKDIVDRCVKHGGVESPFDILDLDDDVRSNLLQLSDAQMQDVAAFCNSFPVVDLSFEVQDADSVTAGDSMRVVVKLARDVDDEDDDMDAEDPKKIGVVSAPFYPKEKVESWWVVLGDTKAGTILAIKRTQLEKKLTLNLDCLAPAEAGAHKLKLYLMCDSYLGVDQEFDIDLNVAEGEEEGDEEDEDEDGDDDVEE